MSQRAGLALNIKQWVYHYLSYLSRAATTRPPPGTRQAAAAQTELMLQVARCRLTLTAMTGLVTLLMLTMVVAIVQNFWQKNVNKIVAWTKMLRW